jgi:hypothetical protein
MLVMTVVQFFVTSMNSLTFPFLVKHAASDSSVDIADKHRSLWQAVAGQDIHTLGHARESEPGQRRIVH